MGRCVPLEPDGTGELSSGPCTVLWNEPLLARVPWLNNSGFRWFQYVSIQFNTNYPHHTTTPKVQNENRIGDQWRGPTDEGLPYRRNKMKSPKALVWVTPMMLFWKYERSRFATICLGLPWVPIGCKLEVMSSINQPIVKGQLTW